MTRVMIRAVDQTFVATRLRSTSRECVSSSSLPFPRSCLQFALPFATCCATRESGNICVFVALFPPHPSFHLLCMRVCKYQYICRAGSHPLIVRSRVLSLDLSRSPTLTVPISPSLSLSPFLSLSTGSSNGEETHPRLSTLPPLILSSSERWIFFFFSSRPIEERNKIIIEKDDENSMIRM